MHRPNGTTPSADNNKLLLSAEEGARLGQDYGRRIGVSDGGYYGFMGGTVGSCVGILSATAITSACGLRYQRPINGSDLIFCTEVALMFMSGLRGVILGQKIGRRYGSDIGHDLATKGQSEYDIRKACDDQLTGKIKMETFANAFIESFIPIVALTALCLYFTSESPIQTEEVPVTELAPDLAGEMLESDADATM